MDPEEVAYQTDTMKTPSLSENRLRLDSLVDAVHDTNETVVITRNRVPEAVLLSPDEVDSWRETVAIGWDREFMGELREGLAALKAGRARLYTVDQLFED
jgi:prevent-host-death family protein